MGKKFGAFTLAEVLITLTIIGIIAALTIPNLMQRYQEQTTVNKVKKFYSTLSNAYAQAQKEYGTADEWGLTGENAYSATKIYNILFKPYFKISKICGTNNKGECLINYKYKYLNNQVHNLVYANNNFYYSLILNDGSSIWLKSGGTSMPIGIFYDINGKNSPNQVGKDLFSFVVLGTNTNNIKPDGIASSNCVGKNVQGWGCSAWLIYKGNMDYLHCSDLSWNGKNKCR